MSIKENLDIYLKNLNYQLQVQNMGLNSWGDVKPRQQNRQFELPSTDKLLNNKKETENKQLARQQQVQLYLEKEKRPITINGVEYKYNTLPEPRLEETDTYKQDVEQAKNELRIEEDNKKGIIGDIKDSEKEKVLLEKELKKFDDIINNLIIEKDGLEIVKVDLYAEQEKIKNEITRKKTKLTKTVTKSDKSEQDKTIIDTYPELINNLEERLKNLTSEINKINIAIGDLDDEYQGLVPTPIIIKTKLKNINSILTRLYTALKNTEIEIENRKDGLTTASNKYNMVEKENKKAINNYADELRRVNFGSFNVEKIGNETDDEYLKRLTTNSQIPFDNSTTKTLSDIERNNMFKDNLKMLFQSDAYIEQILNYLKTTNDHFIFIFNQYFNLFKDDYLKIFGYDNKTIQNNPEEFIDLVENFCQAGEDGKPELITPSKEIQQRQNLTSNDLVLSKLSRIESFIDPTKYYTDLEKQAELLRLEQEPNLSGKDQFVKEELKSEQDVITKITNITKTLLDNDTLIEINNNGRLIYLRYFDKTFTKGDFVERDNNGNIIKINETYDIKKKQPPIILMSSTGELGTFNELRSKKGLKYSIYGDLLVDIFGLDAKAIQKLFKQSNTGELEPKNIQKIINILGLKPTQIQGNPALIKNGSDKRNSILGYGIKDETPEYVEFGKYILLLKKLFLKNILSLQKKNHQKIAGFKNYNVSNEFVNLIMKILKKENISTSDIANLKIGEKELLDNLLSLCELNKKIITGSGIDTISKVKEQLKLIEGQIEAGNNNPVLKDELYKTLFKLVNFGAISEKQARAHYKNICNDFF